MNAHEQRLFDELRAQTPAKGELRRLRATVRRLRGNVEAKTLALRHQRDELSAVRRDRRRLRAQLANALRRVGELEQRLERIRWDRPAPPQSLEALCKRWPKLSAAARREAVRARMTPQYSAA